MNFNIQICNYSSEKKESKLILNHFYSHYILITKMIKDFNFLKDNIREKHIWKEIEWKKIF